MDSNLPADFREEEELSPEEQIALAEAMDNDMDDDSDELAEEMSELSEEDEEIADMSETTEDPLKEIGD